MRRAAVLGVGLLSIAAFAGAASGADLPSPIYTKAPALVAASSYDWSGFYIGLSGGGASSRECWTLTSDNGRAVVPNRDEGCHNATGGLVGGQFGYRWQAANWVFGVEAQGDWTSLTGSNPSLALTVIPVTNQTRIDAVGLLTGQAGYTWNNVLLYVRGGAAVVHNRFTGFFTATGFQVYDTSEVRWGGAVGAGIEFAFAPNWSVAIEYDHLFMGNPDVVWPATNLAVSRNDNIRQDVDIGLVRVNYRFGGPIVAKY